MKGDYSQLDYMTAVFATDNKSNWFPDIYDKRIFMVTKRIADVFSIYLDSFEYKVFCVLDQVNNKHEYYYIPLLPVIDCRKGGSQGKILNYHFDALRLDYDILAGIPACAVKDTIPLVIISNLEVVESILRRAPKGVQIRRL